MADAEETRPRSVRDAYRRLRVLIACTDLAVVVLAAVVATPLRFGSRDDVRTGGPLMVDYWAFGFLLAGGWFFTVQLFRTLDARILGEGVEEFRRIIRATVIYFGWVAIVSLVFKIDSSRGYLAIAFPLGTVALLVERRVWRAWLHRRREDGEMRAHAMVIGGRAAARTIIAKMHTDRRSVLRVTGVWVPDATADASPLQIGGSEVPVLGREQSLLAAVRATGAEMAIISDTEHLGHAGLNDLVWELEEMGVGLLVSPNVVDVADSRIGVTTVARMPFVSLRPPTYGDAAAWPKKMFDRLGSAALIALLSPVLLVTALAVVTTSRGPVLYRQERVGRDGEPFDMLKFRSMRVGADAELGGLLAERGSEMGVLAKVTDDPRVTPVGRFIRRFSLDELPQLFNVLGGTMSLVGPRPQRQFEVDLYDRVAHRRLRVLPGVTGLWQVSGRSDLSWEEAIKLDTYYVENWSMTGDLYILWRTIRAVLTSDGAY
jgi:exopolysaccharide biosynthesis polyprenyl glycosylphosphotransferase